MLTEGPHGLDLRAAREVVFLQVGANYLNESYLLLVSPRTGEVLFFCFGKRYTCVDRAVVMVAPMLKPSCD